MDYTEKDRTTVQALFQDIPLQLSPSSGALVNENQRLGAVLYLQRMRFSAVLFKAASNTLTGSGNPNQAFRITVIRWKGESDINVVSSNHNGWDIITGTAH